MKLKVIFFLVPVLFNMNTFPKVVYLEVEYNDHRQYLQTSSG